MNNDQTQNLMFCPNCSKGEQKPESFCRRCGKFLPDFERAGRRQITPQEHLKANSILNVMTAIASLTLAILLYVIFLGKADTPVIIYVTAGFLTAMFAWQVQIFWRSQLLKKQIILPRRAEIEEKPKEVESFATRELLNEADLSDRVPASVTENTTKNLTSKVERSS